MSTPTTSIRLAAAEASRISPVRKKFNTLIKKLETQRARLAQWDAEVPTIRSVIAGELMPLIATYETASIESLKLLDAAYADKIMGKKDREKLDDLICNTAQQLIESGNPERVIRDIYDRHLGHGDDLEEAEQGVRDMVRASMGVELGDDVDFSSPRAIFEAVQKKIDEQASAEESRQAAHEAAHEAARSNAKPSARELRHQAEETKLKHSLRDIFRKLASTLHPDRETDPAERLRKTSLMQRANAAYAANDLLGLLELQLEVDQIDQAGLDKLTDDRIKQYNKILSGQLAEIDEQIMALEISLSLDIGLNPGQRVTPKSTMRDLRIHIIGVKNSLRHLEADLDRFRDPKALKAWLKGYRITGPLPVDHIDPWF
jgi:hypothetical protein